MGRRKSCKTQQQQLPPGDIGPIYVVNEWCPGCGEFGHTVAISPTQYQGEEWEEPECPVPEWEEPELPVPEWEEPECPKPEWEEPKHPKPKREESVHPQPKGEESVRPQPKEGGVDCRADLGRLVTEELEWLRLLAAEELSWLMGWLAARMQGGVDS
ncbi:UNVERIFIED_CONTAM: hypothetical protein FKN15_069139 [Acipenser sinensis]